MVEGGGAASGKRLRGELRGVEKKWVSELEAELWLEVCGGDAGLALERMREKAQWREKVGRVSMSDCARFFGTDGFTVCLEGLRDRRGRSIVYSNGIPRGTATQIRCQTVYLQERILANARSPDQAKALTLIDTRPPSFRPPDPALRTGGIDVIDQFYPWSNKGTTVFIALPTVLRQFVALTKPFFPKDVFDRFQFADDFHHLAPDFIPRSNLPKRWGGNANWSLRYYVPARCLQERTFCKPAPRNL